MINESMHNGVVGGGGLSHTSVLINVGTAQQCYCALKGNKTDLLVDHTPSASFCRWCTFYCCLMDELTGVEVRDNYPSANVWFVF